MEFYRRGVILELSLVSLRPQWTRRATAQIVEPAILMGTANASTALNKRALIVHDGLAFLSLVAVSITLFGVTFFLFRSFQSHRADLGVEWAKRGRMALAEGRPEEAVTCLRTALSYAPDEEPDQMLLAEALASAGHTEEATNYFLNLWDEQPGDGFTNLQLARLSVRTRDWEKATNYYRASIFGSWEGDGVVRRRDVRLEFVDFLTRQRQYTQARNVLFVISGNSPLDAPLNLLLAQKFEAIGDSADALTFYEKTLRLDSHNRKALARGGDLAYTLGDYRKAQILLERVVQEKPEPANDAALAALLQNTRRIRQLTMTHDQPAGERADHILLASTIAQSRLKSCMAQAIPDSQNVATPAVAQLRSLSDSWSAETAGGRSRSRVQLENAATQDTWTQLIYQTEQTAKQVCGDPIGDDALLMRLANSSQPTTGGKD